jgi:phage terminase small subunit
VACPREGRKTKVEPRAAIDAGYSPDSAHAIASENLRKLEIANRIQKRIAEAASLTPNEIIGTLTTQMRADVTDFLDDQGNVDVERIKQQGLGHLVKKFKVRRTCEGSGENKAVIDVVEIELYDAQEAASRLARITSMDNHPQRVDIVEIKREKLTIAVQNGLNSGWPLRDTLEYLTLRGVSKEDLELVRGEDLVFPTTELIDSGGGPRAA